MTRTTVPLVLTVALLATGCLGLPGDDPAQADQPTEQPWVAIDGLPAVVHHRTCEPQVTLDLQLSAVGAPELTDVEVTVRIGQVVDTVELPRLGDDTLVHRQAVLVLEGICDPPEDRRIHINATARDAAPNRGSLPLVVHGTDLDLVEGAVDRFTCQEVTFWFEIENTGAVALTNLSAEAVLWDPKNQTYLGARWEGLIGDVPIGENATTNGTISFDGCPPQAELGLILRFHHRQGEPIPRSYQLRVTKGEA